MSELYDLPNGWEWKKLSEIGKISTGKTPPKANKEFYENGTIRFVKPPNLQNSFEITELESDEFVTEDGAKKSTMLPTNSLMVCCIGSLGKFALTTENVITNQQINSIIFNENIINYKYGYYYGFKFEKLLNEVANEAVVKIVNKSIFSNLDIPLPPLSEQQRIVLKLDNLFEKIDKSIALHQKNMDEANVFMGSVLNDVFGELEEKYEKYRLEDLTSLITKGTTPTTNGYKFQNSGINFLKIENIINGEIDLSSIEMFISEEAHQSQKRSQLEINDVLFSIAGTIGDTAIVKKEHLPMNTNQAIALIRPTQELNSEFLRRLLSSSISNETTNKQRGGAIKNVSLGDIKETIIPLPALKIQQKVVKYLDEVSEKIERIKSIQKEKMDSLKALKTSILDKAFRGEL